jgi:hypothetical protein
MDDLVQWLGKQLDEDERVAKAATGGPWWYNPGKQWLGPDAFEQYDLAKGEEFVGYGGPHPFTGAVCATGPANNMQSMKDADHIARHDPARVLREIDAKRALIARGGPFCTSDCDDPDNEPKDPDTNWTTSLEHHFDCAAYQAAAALAVPYDHRPGYLEKWRP